MKAFRIYRNIPFVDNSGKKVSSYFFFQILKLSNHRPKRVWIELPFIGFTFRIA